MKFFLTQELLTTIVELEVTNADGLSEQSLVVPDGVTMELRHFLVVPSSSKKSQSPEDDKHTHHLVQITKVNIGYKNQIIDSQTEVSSQYFRSEKLQGKHLCFFAWCGTGQGRHSYMNAPTNIIVTRHKQICAHKTRDTPTLVVYAYSEAASEDRFKDLIEKQGQARTKAVMEEVIGPKDTLRIKVKAGTDWIELKEAVTYLKLLQYNGAIRYCTHQMHAFLQILSGGGKWGSGVSENIRKNTI